MQSASILEKAADETLVKKSLQGDSAALETLVQRYQHWVYNLVLRMVYDPLEADDITQDILIKIITKLGTFEEMSRFKTWLYRVACNHILNVKKSRASGFRRYWNKIQNIPDAEIADAKTMGVENSLIINEIKFECMLGMLICLKPKQRLAFILGALFQFEDTVAAGILRITRVNFRKILSRSRGQLYNFMYDKCSLMKPGNPCRCDRKVKGMIEAGIVDPRNLRFNSSYVKKVKQMIPRKLKEFSNAYDAKVIDLFRDHPFKNQPDFNKKLSRLINIDALLTLFSVENPPRRQ
jgi:RNA polymerase sigma factor (sigma-70 family)